MAFLSLRVDSINIKGSFLHLVTPAFFCSYLSFISIILLVLPGDTETNPGPDLDYSNIFSVCHWNVNTITAHNFINPLMCNVPKWSNTL